MVGVSRRRRLLCAGAVAPLLIGVAALPARAQLACTGPDTNNVVHCTNTTSINAVGGPGAALFGLEGNGTGLVILNSAGIVEAAGNTFLGIESRTTGFNGLFSGDNGGAAGSNSINTSGIVSTDGPNAAPIGAFALGGTGAGGSNGTFGGGGDGGNGGAGGAITITGTGGLGSDAAFSAGVLAVSEGGNGGNGGDAGATGSGGNGGTGGAGGTIFISGNWNITSTFNLSEGIRATSLGGTAGNSGGGFLFTGAGTGGGASGGGAVTVNFSAVPVAGQTFAPGKIITTGIGSNGIFAESVGGFSGSGGSGGFFVGNGGGALSGGPGGAVTVTTIDPNKVGLISTSGIYAVGILAESVGGGGGSAGGAGAAGFVGGSLTGANGASGGAGGDGGQVIVTNQMTITTLGDGSRGILAQSVGGGGGDGGSSAGIVSYGGSGAGGGVGGNVTVNNSGVISTGKVLLNGVTGLQADAIFAQSVGGGGGDGGNSTGAVSLGGSGASGGWGGDVSVANSGSITTVGAQAHGIFAQSVGGGGGDGGNAVGALALGGSGASSAVGSFAGLVIVDNSGAITTTGAGSDALFGQSVGGGGGRGGNATGGVSVGGTGGGGGSGDEAFVRDYAPISATGAGSRGIVSQSIGGGGGSAGLAVGLASFGQTGGGGGPGGFATAIDYGAVVSSGSAVFAQSVGGGGGSGSLAVGFASFGGAGGSGGGGGGVFVTDIAANTTTGSDAAAIFAQSVGGGGGDGGGAVAGLQSLNFTFGGSAGGGGAGGGVTVNAATDLATGQVRTASISTLGDRSDGVFAQSVGGGGGHGGEAITGSLGGSLAVGGKGGNGGSSFGVTVSTNGVISTQGTDSTGIFAQSVGGGGGDGGMAIAASLNPINPFAASIAVGGSGGGGGAGGAVNLTSASAISTLGDRSDGVFAQSVGGGGGEGGLSIAIAGSGVLSLAVGLGGTGGSGGVGANVTVSQTGSITTGGAFADAVLAQSIGGGGGDGGLTVGGVIAGGAGAAFTMGGKGAIGGTGGVVNVNVSGALQTSGADAGGIIAQSIGGGGGDGGLSANAAVGGVGAGFSASLGGSAGSGSSGGAVTEVNSGSILTGGANADGVLAQSIGGGGGTGGGSIAGAAAQSVAAVLSLGGNGGSGGFASTVKLTSASTVTTAGTFSDGLVAQSVGGGGGSGGLAVGAGLSGAGALSIALGGAGGTGGVGGQVTLASTGAVSTAGQGADGLLAQSVGGGGGSGGLSVGGALAFTGVSLSLAMGGNGGAGGLGAAVSLSNTGAISTLGNNADGILAQSLGGGGGNGGFSIGASGADAFGAAVAIGGKGDNGGNSSGVSVTSNATITTAGAFSSGVVGQSIGGGGGDGGFAITGAFSANGAVSAAFGGSAGVGGSVTNVSGTLAPIVNVTTGGAISTAGTQADGVVAQSIGGGGGDGGFAIAAAVAFSGESASLAMGGKGGSGGAGGIVNLTNSAVVNTLGLQADGLVAQSIGGGGGNGGFSVAVDVGINFAAGASLGGTGGGGNTAGQVSLSDTGAVTTAGSEAPAILAQSIGGGGGNGGFSVTAVAANANFAGGLSVGGSGGTGAASGIVTVSESGALSTSGYASDGLLAQSIGGGGGDGGFSATGVVANRGAVLAVGFGGTGGSGNIAAPVQVTASGAVITASDNSAGIVAQSIGGGGGSGGFSLAAGAAFESDPIIFTAALGGSGGTGAASGTVSLSSSGNVFTFGNSAPGVMAQSIGGGGGSGGFSVSGVEAFGNDSLALAFSIGGSGGVGGTANTASATTGGTIITTGNVSDGVVVQSIGGGGGDGGFSVAATNAGGNANGAQVALGGSGGSGNLAGSATLIASGAITTYGVGSQGLMVQSVGGGGGQGGFSATGLNAESQTANFGLAMGGVGGVGGNAGNVFLISSDTIVTNGALANGVFAQSVGGGGGDGGLAVSANFTGVQNKSTSLNLGATAAVGGTGGNAGNGGQVNATVSGAGIITFGQNADAIFAQSVGGGGGEGGLSASGGVAVLGENATTQIALALGGGGGEGGQAGAVYVASTAPLTTRGADSDGVFAQSVGGGGGVAGGAISLDLGLNSGETGRLISVAVALGGNGGTGNTASLVNVTSSGKIVTSGVQSDGIFAQSVGGGGGVGGLANSMVFQISAFCTTGANASCVKDKGDTNLATTVSVGGKGGAGGTGGQVNVSNTGRIATNAALSDGILAQSIGGGGGDGAAGANGLSNLIPTTLSLGTTALLKPYQRADNKSLSVNVGGTGGASGDGGTVILANSGFVSTVGVDAIGITAQSVGGGGGMGGLGDAGLLPGVIKIGAGGNGGASGSGGMISLTNSGTVTTAGQNATAILAQSVGGGGGLAGGAHSGLFAIGGNGGVLGGGGAITLINTANLVSTLGDFADGVEAQSIGGGGGQMMLGLGQQNAGFDNATAGAIAIGGEGSAFGPGGQISLTSNGMVTTAGVDSVGLDAQSVGGGGGNGGAAFGAFSLGGAGGSGGNGGQVSVVAGVHSIVMTKGAQAYALLAQSVGGGGGSGGANNTTLSLGGGGGGNGGFVTVSNSGVLSTGGYNAPALIAQSVGGGGGLVGSGSGALTLGGASSGASQAVVVTNKGRVATAGDFSPGVLAQAVGGGGGLATEINAGMNVNVGGSGGNAGFQASVINSATITTTGVDSAGIIAQNVGGGGGLIFANVSLNYAAQTPVNGYVSGSGNGGQANVTDTGMILTTGDFAYGIIAQSVGGGGGFGGIGPSVFAPTGLVAGFAGSAGGPGASGPVSVIKKGAVVTEGAGADAIFAESASGTGATGPVSVDIFGQAIAQGTDSNAIEIVNLTAGALSANSLRVEVGGTVYSNTGDAVLFTGGASNSVINLGTLDAPVGYVVASLQAPVTIRNSGFLAGSILAASGSSFTNNAGAMFASGLFVNLSGGTLTNVGTLAPAGVGVVGTTAMSGVYKQQATGALAIDLDLGLASADLLAITGPATVAGQLIVNPIDVATVKPGDNVVTVLTATGALNHTGLTIVQTSSLVTVTLDFVNAHTIAVDYGVDYSPDSFGLTGNRHTVGEALDAIQAAGASPLFQSIAPKFFAVSTDAQLGRLYDHLSGEGASGAQQAALFADDQFQRVTSDALAVWRGDSGAFDDGGVRLWAQAYGGGGALSGRAADNSNNLGYGGGGLAAGVQHAIGKHALVGAALADDTTSFNIAADGADGSLGATHLAAYGAVRLASFHALALVDGDFFTLDTRRSFTALGEAELIRGRTHARSYGVSAEAGYDLGVGAVMLTPFLGVSTRSLKTNAYGETTVAGPDLFALDFADHRTRSTQSTLGLQLNPKPEATGRARPYLRLEWRHEFSPDRGVTAEFADFAGAQPYDIIGAPAARNLARAEAGVDWSIARGTSLFVGLSGEAGAGEANGGGHAGVRWTW